VNTKDFLGKYFHHQQFLDCEQCGKKDYLQLKNRLRCKSCKKEYSLLRGTALEKSHIPKESWFKAVQRYSEKASRRDHSRR
jgi:transposase-like protein